jgi:hypothetical protein
MQQGQQNRSDGRGPLLGLSDPGVKDEGLHEGQDKKANVIEPVNRYEQSGQCSKAEDRHAPCGKIPYRKEYRETQALQRFQDGRSELDCFESEAASSDEIGPQRRQGDDPEER